ncbi:MAG: glycosyltransferase [Phycisphaerae bacterium]
MKTDAAPGPTSPVASNGPASDDAAPRAGPIHVVHLFGTLLPGGAERQALTLVQHRDAAHFRHTAINTCAAENALAPQFEAAGCPVQVLDKRSHRYPGFLRALCRMLRDLHPDVVHTWLYAPNFWGRAAAIWAGVPGLVASTRTGRRYDHRYECWLDRWLSRRTAVRLVNAAGVRDALVQQVGLRAESIRIVANGVNAARLAPSADRAALRARLGWPVDAPVLLSVGRLVWEKDYPMLFRAVVELRGQFPSLRVAVAGWGPEQARLEALRTELGLDDCVELLGPREDVGDLLAAADLFVMTSVSEGFSNALAGGACGSASRSSARVNGAVEVVRHEETGLMVEPRDGGAFSRAVARLLSDAALAARLAQAGAAQVQAHYSVAAMVAQHEAAYRAATAGAN